MSVPERSEYCRNNKFNCNITKQGIARLTDEGKYPNLGMVLEWKPTCGRLHQLCGVEGKIYRIVEGGEYDCTIPVPYPLNISTSFLSSYGIHTALFD